MVKNRIFMIISPLVILGYTASVLVAISLMMNNIRRLRWVNLVGALAFSAYGLWIKAWPVFGVNLFISIVDIYFLERMAHQKDFFTLLKILKSSPLLEKFLRFHKQDIQIFFPDTPTKKPYSEGCFVLRNMLPVGLFLYNITESNIIEIKLDYVIPEYRDDKNGEFLFRILNEQFSGQGYRTFRVKSTIPKHIKYLKRQGFSKTEKEIYEKPII
jgi:hypothetical protein